MCGTSVSNQCRCEGNAAPRSQIFSGPDQAERRILRRQPLGIVRIFVSCQPTINGLSQQIRER